ncbi:MAG: hypothetical protein KBB91_00885 [Candidatus Pacebacteria bacterium]|nr:hypothetical protein [Candidatus Paceibacterota bacterium]MBP9701040.1 hypothetical protein [Candidatus Paceibacterota bacterium]
MARNTTYAFFGSIVLFSLLSYAHLLNAQTITQSGTVSIGATVGSIPTLDGGGSGGGGVSTQSGVKFSGIAYPGAIVTIQKGTTIIATVSAGSTGIFSIVVPGSESHMFTLIATDSEGRRSVPMNFPVVLYNGLLTDIGGIRFAPTIITDKIGVKQGEYLSISGAATPLTPLKISIQGAESTFFALSADAAGRYSITIPVLVPFGTYTVKIGYADDKRVSKLIKIVVGTENMYQAEVTTNIPGDYNLDQRVTILDFSVLAYWFGRKNPPTTVDINKDGIISLIDFSIMAFYWNG